MHKQSITEDIDKYTFSNPQDIKENYHICIKESDNQQIPQITKEQLAWSNISDASQYSDIELAFSLVSFLWEKWDKWLTKDAKDFEGEQKKNEVRIKDFTDTVHSIEGYCILNNRGDLEITKDSSINLQLGGPSICLQQGSILISVLTSAPAALKLSKWAIGLCVRFKYGMIPSDWATKYAERLRSYRKDFKANLQIPTFDDIKNKDKMYLKGKNHIIVLVHGLFSTDIGTFDTLLKQLIDQHTTNSSADSFNPEQTLIVGFPHNTLTNINKNAQSLEEALNNLFEDTTMSVSFLAHSRGGLVARATICRLIENGWKDRINCLVSFGTPHLGAKLAELPDQLIGTAAILQSLEVNDHMWMLMLAYVDHCESLDGVTDMMPLEANDEDFLYNLKDKEKKCFEKGFKLNAMVIGGKADYTSNPKLSRITSVVLNGTDHDLIVSLDSTIPNKYPWNQNRVELNSTHFKYFSEDHPKAHLEVLNYLLKRHIKGYQDNINPEDNHYIFDYTDGSFVESATLSKKKRNEESKRTEQQIKLVKNKQTPTLNKHRRS